MTVVRLGFVGVGVKGTEHLENLLNLPGVELRAVCDIDLVACTKAQQMAEKAGQRKTTAYTRGDHDFERARYGPLCHGTSSCRASQTHQEIHQR